jgi:hypothetical protein
MKTIKLAALALTSLVVVGCNTPATPPMGEAVVAILQPANPIIGVNQHGAPFELGLLEICPPTKGDPYAESTFYGRITVSCGGRIEVITLY